MYRDAEVSEHERKQAQRVMVKLANPSPATLRLLTDFDSDGQFSSQEYLEFSISSLADRIDQL
jgi:hypothetical protein